MGDNDLSPNWPRVHPYLHVYVFKGCFEILRVRAFQKYHRTNHLGCTSKVADFFSWLTLNFSSILYKFIIINLKIILNKFNFATTFRTLYSIIDLKGKNLM